MSHAQILLPMRPGLHNFVAIMARYNCKVLARRLSNSIDADLCVGVLKEALVKCGTHEIFKYDQGSQFNSGAWTAKVRGAKTGC